MSDDLQDHIDINDPQDVLHWTMELGVDEQTLKGVVKSVGASVAAVRQHLLDKPLLPGG